jgi:porin
MSSSRPAPNRARAPLRVATRNPDRLQKLLPWLVVAAALWLGTGLARAADEAPAADAPAAESEPGLSLAAVYTGESWHALSGGVARGSAYVDNLDLQLKLDGGGHGLPGYSAYLYVLYNNGAEFAAPLVGNLQGISNIEAVPSTRLYEAWVEVPVFGAGSLRGGLYNLNSEFDVNEVGALFLGPSHGIGTEFAHTGLGGPSIFPVTSLALRYKHEVAGWRMQGVLLDGVPGDVNDPRRTYVRVGRSDGALYVAEVGRALGRVQGTLGAWHYTTVMPDLLDVDGNGDPVQRHGSSGAYVMASGALWSDEGSGRDLAAFVRYGQADEHVYQTGSYLGFGIASTGPIASRPKDRLGIAVAMAMNGNRFRTAAAAAGAPVDNAETDFELSYRMILGEHLLVQPDLHYILNPGTDATLANAWAFGLRFQLAWGYARH